MQTYYGLTLPDNFILKGEDMKEWAKLMLVCPSVSPDEAAEISRNTAHFLAADAVMAQLATESEHLKNPVNPSTSVFNEDVHLAEQFYGKFKDWVKKHNPPSDEEIAEITTEYPFISGKKLHSIIEKVRLSKFTSPDETTDYLKQYVIGQDEAVNTIAVIIHEHKLRMETDTPLPKTSPLLIGSTGSGKSFLVNKAREILDIPVVRISCGELLPSGYVGNTLSKCLTMLYQASGGALNNTSKGILHFDEFDKIASYYHKDGDAWKATIQNEILKLFDLNETISFPVSNEAGADTISINTDNLLIIFSGAFSGIEKIILKRLNTLYNGNMKLVDKENIMRYVTSEDIEAYGIIPELASRLSFISPMKKLTPKHLFDIMKNAKDSELQKHMNKCELLGIKLEFTDDAMHTIAQEISTQNLGARHIGTYLSGLLEAVYLNPSAHKGKTIILDAKSIMQMGLSKKYHLVFDAFEKKIDTQEIARCFGLDIDVVLDLFMVWKKGQETLSVNNNNN